MKPNHRGPWVYGTEALGRALIQRNAVTSEQLQLALRKQTETGRYLGEVLLEEGFVTASELYGALSDQAGIPYVDVSTREIAPSVLQLVPEHLARRFTMVPLSLEDGVLTVAVADHLDVVALDTIASNTGYEVSPVLCGRQRIREAIDLHYSKLKSIEKDLQEIVRIEAARDEPEPAAVAQLEAAASDAPVVRFVNLLIHQAIENRASDLHIEPGKNNVRVRVRIDGVLRDLTPPTRRMLPAVVTRIKVLCGMDIGERRLPQDGRCRIEEKHIDIRASTLPTIHGEKVVLRLLDRSGLVLDLGDLGFQPQQRATYEAALARRHGIILVTGPTGSGKTTTLYSGVSYIGTARRNIVTVEDPVEYELPGVSQVQVRAGIGLTFASGLRHILRQDPDVLLVGEIRDLATAEIAVRAALTGHLVLSTLHTNDALSTISRLRDIGVAHYLLGSCLSLVMAQRLVRRICGRCKERYDPPQAVVERLGITAPAEFYRGHGCSACNNTGFYGRIGAFEMVPIDGELGRLISNDASETELRDAVAQRDLLDLRRAVVLKAIAGITAPEEAAMAMSE